MSQIFTPDMIALIQIDLANLRRLATSQPLDFAAELLLEDSLPPRHVAHRSLTQLAAGTPPKWCVPYLIFPKSHNRILGCCGFKSAPINGSVEIGYGVAGRYRARGIATAAVAQLLALAVADGTVQQIVAEILPENIASSQVVSRLGFKKGHRLIDAEGVSVVQWLWHISI